MTSPEEIIHGSNNAIYACSRLERFKFVCEDPVAGASLILGEGMANEEKICPVFLSCVGSRRNTYADNPFLSSILIF